MKLKLRNVNYDIKMTTKLDKDLDDARGKIFYEELKILLDKDLPNDLKIQTLYHEIAHAICDQSFFNDVLLEKLGDDEYEIMVDSIGTLLYDIIHSNNMFDVEEFVLKNSKK